MSSDRKTKAGAMAQIRQFGDPVLKEKSHYTQAEDDLRGLVQRMIKIMYAADGVGLAAPQIGVLRQVIVFRLGEEEPRALINPEITWKSEETITDSEGCLSLASLAVEVERAAKIRVKGQSLEGKEVEFELEGMPARILQHEIDHLHGTLIADRTTPEQRKQLMSRLRKIELPGE